MGTPLYKLLLLLTVVSECSCIQWPSSEQYRLTFLEAENRQLKDRLVDVTNQANAETHKANVRINENKAEINENKAETNQAYTRVSNVLSQLVQHLEDEKPKQVSFYATALNDTYRPVHGDTLIPINVPLNQGNGFDLSTGKFTAPFNGTYSFKAGRWGYGSLPSSFYYGNVYLAVDGKQEPWVVTSFDGNNDAVSFKAIVSVRAGQSVWLQAGGKNHWSFKGSHSNWFSGFLVSSDP
uniref:Type 2 C1q domain-containing protein 10 n=1 Tax=Littorina littorea TaxID=31216 RepID=A0A411DEN3_LITLI|nr:type 2 C1q domain-containing protein 10 [Littorina littorea]